MTDLTLEELTELERLSEAASPGPWHREMLELGGRVPMTLGIGGPTRAVCIVSGVAESPAGLRDVAHIVTTKNALPALLAMASELVRLKGALDHLENFDKDQGQHFWEPNEIYRSAKRIGWADPLPPSERKGEG